MGRHDRQVTLTFQHPMLLTRSHDHSAIPFLPPSARRNCFICSTCNLLSLFSFKKNCRSTYVKMRTMMPKDSGRITSLSSGANYSITPCTSTSSFTNSPIMRYLHFEASVILVQMSNLASSQVDVVLTSPHSCFISCCQLMP